MYLNHQFLTHINANVSSVKADAFTSDANHLELVKSLLNFDNNMGSGRLSNTDDISCPKVKLNLKVFYPTAMLLIVVYSNLFP